MRLRVGRLKAHLLARVKRVRGSSGPILQCAVAAGLAWLVAANVIGHPSPFFAPISAIICLGVSLGARLRRAAELVVGVSLGVLVGDLLIAWIGSGWWQIILVVVLAMAIAVFADGAALLVAQAGSSAVLVATLLPPGQSGGLARCIDALVGGAVGLLVAGLLPTDPVAPVRRTSRQLLDELAQVLTGTADALRADDPDRASEVLRKARATQPVIDELRAALRGGAEITRVSPLLRRRRGVLRRFTELAERSDYAMRNARVLARRCLAALQAGEPAAPQLADIINELAAAVGVLTAQLHRDGHREQAREPVLDVVRHAVELDQAWRPGPSEMVMLAQVRSIALDLLQATGMTRGEAQDAMHAV